MARLLTSGSPGIPPHSQVNRDAAPNFSYDATKLFVQTSPIPAPPDPRLATLLDESGLLWVSASSRLDRQLQAGQWRELLVANREQVRAMVLPIVMSSAV